MAESHVIGLGGEGIDASEKSVNGDGATIVFDHGIVQGDSAHLPVRTMVELDVSSAQRLVVGVVETDAEGVVLSFTLLT